MKVKLLRKFRKRFYWFKKEDFYAYYYYDKELNKELSSFIIGHADANDMLIATLLGKLGLSYLYESNSHRQDRRKKVKIDKALRLKYQDKFK